MGKEASTRHAPPLSLTRAGNWDAFSGDPMWTSYFPEEPCVKRRLVRDSWGRKLTSKEVYERQRTRLQKNLAVVTGR